MSISYSIWRLKAECCLQKDAEKAEAIILASLTATEAVTDWSHLCGRNWHKQLKPETSFFVVVVVFVLFYFLFVYFYFVLFFTILSPWISESQYNKVPIVTLRSESLFCAEQLVATAEMAICLVETSGWVPINGRWSSSGYAHSQHLLVFTLPLSTFFLMWQDCHVSTTTRLWCNHHFYRGSRFTSQCFVIIIHSCAVQSSNFHWLTNATAWIQSCIWNVDV